MQRIKCLFLKLRCFHLLAVLFIFSVIELHFTFSLTLKQATIMSDAGSYKSDAEDTMHSTSTPIRDMVGI